MARLSNVSLLIFISVFANLSTKNKCYGHINNIKSKTPPEIQAATVRELIIRTIPEKADNFLVEVIPGTENTEYFYLQSTNGLIKITANTGVAAATGFNYYLKYYCNCHISWEVSQLNLPDPLPEVNITIEINDRFRYYQNVCTESYSFVWWTWEQWEKHIDWMALNSFNLVLAFNGQEIIWNRVYQKFNLTQQEIDEHFTGPAFLAWLRMGNMRGFNGPLSNAWHLKSIILHKQVLARMRNFGIVPVLPAFAGHVPRAFKRLYPDVNMVQMAPWGGMPDEYCCPYFLDPTEQLFNTIGKAFMEEQISEYGSDHVYNCDSFNEMTPVTTDLNYLRNVGESVYKAMTDVDPEAIWMLQGWMFVADSFWSDISRAEALLTSVPQGEMLILDLQSERNPQYERYNQFFGQPYIWCMLHNFGGALGMQGSFSIINQEPIRARNLENSTMIGIGLTMEGINQNYVIYEFMAETSLQREPRNITEWIENYAIRRYGQREDDTIKVWNNLQATVYDYNGTDNIWGQYIISNTPNLLLKPNIWYSWTGFSLDFNLFLNASTILTLNSGYLHDLVDITRQMLQIYGDVYGTEMINAYLANDIENFVLFSGYFLEVFIDLDLILQTNPAFLLGRWLESAKNCADNPQDEALFEYGARNQITLWGPRGENMNYAAKQWAGIVSDFFAPRWSLYISYMTEVLNNGLVFNQTYIEEKMFNELEEPFTFNRSIYSVEPKGKTVEIAEMIRNKWATRNLF